MSASDIDLTAARRETAGHGAADWLERFPAKWTPVRVKNTRQIKNLGRKHHAYDLEPRSDSIGTEKALGLAAAPAFACMALVTAASGGDTAEMLCSAAHASPLGGMVPMYLLMTAFHLTPWLRLFGRRRNGACP
jgi:hypothetical protein